MPKLTLSDLANLSNENSAVTTINNNSAAIETALENTLSRDGTTPNSMGADLDLNSNDILNVASLEADTIEATSVEADNFTVDGVSLNILLIDWEGQWLTATSYLVGDVVYNLGSSYICTVAHESAALTQPGVGANWEDNWDLVVQKGDQGIQGVPGDLTQAVADTLYQPLDSDLTAIAGLAKSDGNIIVGDGSTWVAESAGTARTSLGLGTADTPQFTGVHIQATDTTVTRFAAGDISVEGNRVYRAGGADVAIADGGTGASSATAAATNLGLGTGDTPQFVGVNIGATDTTITRTGAGDIAVEGNAIYRAGGTDVPVADGGSGRSDATAYAVICGGTTSTAAQQSIASVGAAGEVLTSNGAGALPTFQAAGGGGLSLLTSGTVAAQATLDIVLTSYTSFRAIKILLQGFVPVTNDVELWMRLSSNGGSSYDSGASDYDYSASYFRASGTTTFYAVSAADDAILISGQSTGTASVSNVAAEGGADGEITLYGRTSTGRYTRARYAMAFFADLGESIMQNGAASRKTAQDTDAVRFLFESGNIASGAYAVYGMA